MTVKPLIVHVILILVVSQGWKSNQLDINNPFLQGTLQEEVFVSQPLGFLDHARPDHVYKLN